MIRLTNDINATLRAEVTDGKISVSCVTCHRDATEPRTLQAVLLATQKTSGIDAAALQYRQLREEFYSRATYDFGESNLLDLAGDLSREGDDYAAIEWLRLNLAFFPESGATLAHLAGALHDIGAKVEAKMRIAEALAIDPDNRSVRRQMNRILGEK